jgi:hypothetical protein
MHRQGHASPDRSIGRDHLPDSLEHCVEVERLGQEAVRAVVGSVCFGVGQEPGISRDNPSRDAGGIGIRT